MSNPSILIYPPNKVWKYTAKQKRRRAALKAKRAAARIKNAFKRKK
jgi:hypothetical protein